MSNYFARLAQRTGFVTPPVPAAARTEADILEQNLTVESASRASAAAPAAGPAQGASATPAATASPSAGHPLAQAARPAVSAPMASAIPNPAPSAIAAEAPKPPVSHDTPLLRPVESSLLRRDEPVADRIALKATEPREVTVSALSPAPAPATLPEIEQTFVLPAGESVRPATQPPPSAAPVTMVPAASAGNREAPRRDGNANKPVGSPVDRKNAVPSAYAPPMRSAGPPVAALFPPVAASVASPLESPSHEVAVHIGSVRVEIHAPTPTPAPLPAAPAPVPHEPPRFSPRRHYLRG